MSQIPGPERWENNAEGSHFLPRPDDQVQDDEADAHRPPPQEQGKEGAD